MVVSLWEIKNCLCSHSLQLLGCSSGRVVATKGAWQVQGVVSPFSNWRRYKVLGGHQPDRMSCSEPFDFHEVRMSLCQYLHGAEGSWAEPLVRKGLRKAREILCNAQALLRIPCCLQRGYLSPFGQESKFLKLVFRLKNICYGFK